MNDFEGRQVPGMSNTPATLQLHMERLKSMYGRDDVIITRFPPEPNGFLHLGHAKAIHANYEVASKHGGLCILRLDDTNPSTEKKSYMSSIIENVVWLTGKPPAKVTYSSDYFETLYELALKLIRKGKAYVCHQTRSEIKLSREKKQPSPFRDRSVEENLGLFEGMRRGKFAEGAATLRLKGNLEDKNPQMWDLIAYRIKYLPHPRARNKWCIYPSYDYSHCIIDSLEDITYSLCTLEFEIRRESYYWLLSELDLYRPKVWEFSRLNVKKNPLSKRKLLRLVQEKHVQGWDDPRLLTLNGLRRRGYVPAAIMGFCHEVGLTRTENVQSPRRMENCVRKSLHEVAKRVLVVAEPLRVDILNSPSFDYHEELAVPDFPFDVSRGSHSVSFSSVLYIARKDFRLCDSKDYYGLAPGKEVHLVYAYNITCASYKLDEHGNVERIEVFVDWNNTRKCRGKIGWVAQESKDVEPLRIQLRHFENLFRSDQAKESKDWLQDLNPKSLTILTAFGEKSLKSARPGERYQLLRMGYYIVDTDLKDKQICFNRTVSLNS